MYYLIWKYEAKNYGRSFFSLLCKTQIHRASFNIYFTIVEFLIKTGLNKDLQDKNGQTPLDLPVHNVIIIPLFIIFYHKITLSVYFYIVYYILWLFL